MEFELLMDGPYHLARCALAFSKIPSDGTDIWITPCEIFQPEYRRLHVMEGEPVLAIVRQDPGAEGGKARLLVRTHPTRPRNSSPLRERVAWQFQADASPEGFYRRAGTHPVLAPLIRALYGVRPLRPSTVFEMAAIAISEQKISLPAAVQIRSRMVRALGRKMVFQDKEYRAFPTEQDLARCSVDDLRRLSFTARKAEYLIDLARKVTAGEVDLEGLRNRSNEEVISVLTSLRGFGRWSAEYLLARGLGRTEVVPGGDVGIQNLVGRALGSGRRASEPELRKMMEEWGPDKRWVVFYLFCASRLGLLE